MKFCPNCGKPLLTANPKFCHECGTNLEVSEPRPEHAIITVPRPEQPQMHVDAEQRQMNAYELGKHFEEKIATIFENEGYTVGIRKKVPTKSTAVCEFDILLERGQTLRAVECKNYQSLKTVGIHELHEFKSKLLDSGIYSGIFVTSTGYSEDAETLASQSTDTHIDLWDRKEVMERLLSTATGRGQFASDEHMVLPLATTFATASNIPLKNRHVVHMFNPKLIYHPYIQVGYRLQARRKDKTGKTHHFGDSGTYFVDGLDGDIINRDWSIATSIGSLLKRKEDRLASREDKMVVEDLRSIPPVTKAILSPSEYKTIVEKPSYTIEEAAETVRDYVIKKNTKDVSYEMKIKGELETRTLHFTPEASEISISSTKLVHTPQWNIDFEAGRSVLSRRILASSNRTLVDGLATCSKCTMLKKPSVAVCEECGRPLCEKHSYNEGRWLCLDHVSAATREEIKSKTLFSRIKSSLTK